jgi:hypothetical protein
MRKRPLAATAANPSAIAVITWRIIAGSVSFFTIFLL